MINSETFEKAETYKIRESYEKLKFDNLGLVRETIMRGTDHNHFGDYMFAFYGDIRLFGWISQKNVNLIYKNLMDVLCSILN